MNLIGDRSWVDGSVDLISFTLANPVGVTTVDVNIQEPHCAGWSAAAWNPTTGVASFLMGPGTSFPVKAGVWPMFVRVNGAQVDGPFNLRIKPGPS